MNVPNETNIINHSSIAQQHVKIKQITRDQNKVIKKQLEETMHALFNKKRGGGGSFQQQDV